MGGKLHLFDEADDSKIEINQEYARRYEHNKKREDLHRLEELKKKGIVSDSESSDDDEEIDGIVSTKVDKKELEKFIDALTKIKNQDPILMDKDAKLFDSETDDDDDDDRKADKKKKGVYMKDFNAEILMSKGADFVDELEGGEGEGVRVKSHAEEQEELRNAFLRSVEEDDIGKEGDLLIPKAVKGGDDDDEFEEVIADKLNEYFSEDEKLDENEMFLKDYFRKRLWERKDGDDDDDDDDGVEISEDEEEIERQEDYERDFNFRFEENTGDRILGHARNVEGSVRKKTNANKVQRDRKKERMDQAEKERKEELKRLKNLKKKEINEKLQKIRETAGIDDDDDGACPLDLDDLEEDFDPEEHDRKMKQAFGENYYEADDVDPEFGSDDEEHEDYLLKPDFDKEDELLGLPKGWDDENETRNSLRSMRERILKQKAECEGNNENAEIENNVVEKVGKRKRKKKISEVEKVIREQLMEEYYKLDYEDTIGDLKTRFKYKPVKPNRFGLTKEEVLMMDDKELNQFVSLNKLAPYREQDWEVPRIKVLELKKKNKELLYGESPHLEADKKRKRDKNMDTPTGKQEQKTEDPPADKKRKRDKNMDTPTAKQEQKTEDLPADESLSQKRKRKERNAEFKLSDSRRVAYGKPPSKPKSKK